MINIIWFLLVCVGLGYSFIFNSNEMNDVILNSATEAFELIKSLLPLIVLWSGLMNIANQSGLLHKFSKLLRPLLKKIFPEVKNSKALDYISSNIAANMIGLGSAATPFGLKAMKELEKENKTPGVATNSMITFLVLNTSGVTLIPMSVIGLRMLHGSASPTAIIVPSIIATFCSSFFGLTLDYIIRRKNANK